MNRYALMLGTAVLVTGSLIPTASATTRYSASAGLQSQGLPLNLPAETFRLVNNPVVFGDPPLPINTTATSSGTSDPALDGSEVTWDASAAVNISTGPAAAPPRLRASASSTLDIASDLGTIFFTSVEASASWTFDITVAGPGPTVYMSPVFLIDGSLLGDGTAVTGGASLSANLLGRGGGFFTLADYPLTTDGSTSIINETVASTALPIETGGPRTIIFNLMLSLAMVDFAGTSTPYDAAVSANFASTVTLQEIRFFADEERTTDISDQITITSDDTTDFNALIPEPTTAAIIGFTSMVWLRRNR
ncbi:MAG: hypothetical protein RIG82_08395 [Phycisphaeraceae bacterium]